MELLAGTRLRSREQDMTQGDPGVRDCWAWDRTEGLKTWQFRLRLRSLFALSKQWDEGSRGRDKHHCRLIQIA